MSFSRPLRVQQNLKTISERDVGSRSTEGTLSLQRITRLVFLLVCACACAPLVGMLNGTLVAHAQVNTASLSGLVTDQTNAALVHAHVTATNNATGLVRETDTDAAGYYSFPDLPIGEYRVVVTMQNFETIEARVNLGTAERVRRDLSLKIGTAQANVEVTDVVNNLSPDDASIGTVIDNNTIQQTPLYLRNWDDLLRMVAGV